MNTIYCCWAEATIYRSQADTLFTSFAIKKIKINPEAKRNKKNVERKRKK